MTGAWYLILLVITAGPYMHAPPPQVWGPFLTEERCIAAFQAAQQDSMSENDWSILAAVCAEGPVPPREMEIRWQQ